MSIARERPNTRVSPTRWVALAVALAVLIAAGVWALMATRAETVAVTRRDITAAVPLTGPVVAPPTDRADIAAPYEAPVAKVYATIGANVRQGEVLAELSLPNAQQAYQQARENVRAAETAYANARRQYDSSISAAQRQVDSARSAERSARSAAPGSSSTSAATDEGSSTASTPAAANPTGTDLATASQARISAEQSLAQAKAERDAALLPLQQQLDSARAEFAQAQSGRKMGEIKSPIRGTVLALNMQPGAVVGKDRRVPVATIVNLDHLQVQGEVRAASAGYVKSGTPATLTVTEVPNQQFDATVQSLTTQVTTGLMGKTQYIALVRVQNRDGLVKPGMHAAVGVKAGEVRNVLAVPNDSLKQDRSGRYVVEVQRGSAWQPTVVEVGMTDGRYTEIKSGLRDGDVVQVKPKLL